MKKLFFGVFVALIASLSSCMDTSYEQAEQSIINIGVTSMLDNDYLIINDSGQKLLAVSIPGDYEYEVGTRVKVVFKNAVKAEEGLAYDYTITISEIEDITVKDLIVIDDLNRDTLGDAGVHFNDVYISGRYLNVNMTFGASNKPHYFNVSYDPDGQSEEEGIHTLVFHHKDNDDYWGATYNGFLSYDLNSLDEILLPPYKILFKGIDAYNQAYEKTIDVEE
ncbi:hypothetical protein [Carboxylicivirga sp. N1Y90]|uniref:NigD1/NigD2 family lipoprotein n=1 Tax=Carboxylicivirga fragile TaxID=3417571 RepID=UPI003D32E5AD|nr:hypothetical protein [Marinilabiliaceae bacterium N1Y90]